MHATELAHLPEPLALDVAAVQRIRAIPKILEVVTHVTGLRFAAVARVTDTHWVACAVKDEMAFGLKPGGTIALATTICDEIRQDRKPVVFGHASTHPVFSTHATPRMYGLESYISVPIVLTNGALFGTLCAVDSRPSEVDSPLNLKLLELFADLIALQLQDDDSATATRSALGGALEGAVRRESLIDTVSEQVSEQVQIGLYAAYDLRDSDQISDRHREQVALIEGAFWQISKLSGTVLEAHDSRLMTEGGLEYIGAPELRTVLQRAFDRVQGRFPGRAFAGTASVDDGVICNARQLSQLIEEIIANVMRNYDAPLPVTVAASTASGQFEVFVRAEGMVVPVTALDMIPDKRSRLAQERGTSPQWDFFIPNEIARALGGTVSLERSAGDAFVFRMPLASQAGAPDSAPARFPQRAAEAIKR